LIEARNRLVDLDRYRIEMLSFMADYDVIVCPAMPMPAKPHHHGVVEITDFSHLMVHNLKRELMEVLVREWSHCVAG
jgi:amidase